MPKPMNKVVESVMEKLVRVQTRYIAFLESQFSPEELERVRDTWDRQEEGKTNG